MSDLLNTLLNDARLWRGHSQRTTTSVTEPTGFKALDNQLGWPRGALSECLLDTPGIGELQLVLPLLSRMTARKQTVFWINPPMTPYAPSLAREGVNLDQLVIVRAETRPDLLWTMENCLRSPITGLVMAWPGSLATREIRRLQLAAEAGQSCCLLFQPRHEACQSSPAALRLALEPDNQLGLRISILKRRGGWPGQNCTLPLQARAGLTRPEQPATVIHGPWPGKAALE